MEPPCPVQPSRFRARRGKGKAEARLEKRDATPRGGGGRAAAPEKEKEAAVIRAPPLESSSVSAESWRRRKLPPPWTHSEVGHRHRHGRELDLNRTAASSGAGLRLNPVGFAEGSAQIPPASALLGPSSCSRREERRRHGPRRRKGRRRHGWRSAIAEEGRRRSCWRRHDRRRRKGRRRHDEGEVAGVGGGPPARSPPPGPGRLLIP